MNVSEERVIFYHAIGRALEQWACVEAEIEEIAISCHPSDKANTIAAGFNAVENLRSKLALCDAMVRQSFAVSPHLEKWSTIYNKTHSLSAKRNKIAHNRHTRIASGNEGRRIALSSTRRATKTESPLFVRDIEAIRREFQSLTYALQNVRALLLGRPSSLPESDTSLNDSRIPSLRHLREQIHTELGFQPQELRRKNRKD